MLLTSPEKEVSKPTFKHIEAEFYKYHQTVREIKKLEQEIIQSTGKHDENVGGGRSNLPTSQTEFKAIRLATHKELQYLKDVAYVIETIYNISPEDYKKLIRLKYWSNRDLKWDAIADELHMSRRKALSMRNEIILAAAELLGWR